MNPLEMAMVDEIVVGGVPRRCYLERGRKLVTRSEDGAESYATECRAMMPLGAEAELELGREAVVCGEAMRVSGLRSHSAPGGIGYVEVDFACP